MFKFIWKNVFRNKRRTVLTILSIGVSIFLLVTMMTVLDMLDYSGEMGEQYHRIVSRHKISLMMSLRETMRPKIKTIEGVVQITPMTWFGGVYIEPKNFFAQFATEPGTFREIFSEYVFDESQWEVYQSERAAVAVGRKLADKYGWKVGDSLYIKGDIYPVDLDLKVRAIFSGPDENQVFFHQKYLGELLRGMYGSDPGRVGTFWMKITSAEDIPRVSAAIDEMFANSQYPTKTETEKAFQMEFVSMMGNIKTLFRNMGLAVTFAILMVAANTMAMSYRERTSEIAVLKTLGFLDLRILVMILSESLLISLFGGIFGAGGAWALYHFVNPTMGFIPFFFVMPSAIVTGLSVSLVVGLIGGGVPAWQASRLSVVDGLRRII